MHDENMQAFCDAIWAWYRRHKRTFPWRDVKITDRTRLAYMILVSEVMLQQTQASRVEVAFKKFIREFPDLKTLSKASNADVLLAWRGMGYNARALRLRDAAKNIVQRFRRQFPEKMEDLLSIKGIGPYTAAAVRNFAFNLPTPCIDTNIRRILHRVFIGPERRDGTWPKRDRILLDLAGAALEKAGSPREWNAALMDFGSLVCTKRSPRCAACPLRHGLCVSAFRVKQPLARKLKREPGREIGGRFVPNRIIRGRIVEFLRDAKRPQLGDVIGRHVCIDWNPVEHRAWFSSLLRALEREELVRGSDAGFTLAR